MSLFKFRLITFDVYTLLQFRTSPGKQYGEIGAMFGVRCNNNEIPKNFKNNWNFMNRLHPNFGKNSKLKWQNWWRQLISCTFRESGVQLPDDKMAKFADELIDIYKTSACWHHSYGAVDFLNYLKIQQQITAKKNNGRIPFSLGVVSNFDPRLDILLRNMKINHFFDFVLNSYDCGHEKPSKEIFNIAMKKSEMHDLKQSECLHVGKLPIIDYIGAKDAGWYAALIHEKNPEYLVEHYGEKINEYYCFPNLLDLHNKMANNFISW